MTRRFIACHKFELDHVFRVTRIIENFDMWNLLRKYKLSSLGLGIFIRTEDTSVKNYFTYLFGLCQDHSSNIHFQQKSMACNLIFI